MEMPARTAATKIPVPVAESQLRLKTAASAAGGNCRWGIRDDRGRRPWMGILMPVVSSHGREARHAPEDDACVKIDPREGSADKG